MKIGKKLIGGLSALALTGMLLIGSASAQPGPGGPGGPGGRRGDPVEMLAQRLQLTDTQKAQVKSIFDKHFEAAKARHEAFEASLTPEQKAERQARRQAWEARRAQGGEQVASNEQRPARTELTDEQRQKMEARHKEMDAERQQIESEIQAVLTPQQRQVLEQMKAERPQHPRGPRSSG